MAGSIHVGIGGWDYAPWRGSFYPPGLPKPRELGYAAERLGAIEINATHYRLQKPEHFRRWAEAVPEGFRFAIKGSRFCTNRRVLAEGAEGLERFLNQGLTELGDKLGPMLWQFLPTKKFDAEDFGAFLQLLPRELAGEPLRHAVEVRHESFLDMRFVDLARARGVAIVRSDVAAHPRLDEATGDFEYVRLQTAREEEPEGFAPAELDAWATAAKEWAAAGRDVYLFMINGAKVRAPAAAQALIGRL